MKLLRVFLALLIVLILTSLLSYGMAPENNSFHWSMFNPMEAIEGFLFMLSFGMGLPLWLSFVIVVLLIVLLWSGFYIVLKRAFFNIDE